MTLQSQPAPALMVTDIPAAHPRVPYFDRMVSLLNGEGVPCRFEVDGDRYAGRRALDAVASGSVQMAWVNAAHLESIDPALGALNLPFFLGDDVLADAARADRALDLIDRLASPAGMRVLGLMRGADQLFVSQRALPPGSEAVQGKRVRVAGPGIYEDIMRAVGAEPVAIPIPDIGNALASGSFDCLFTSPGGWQTQLGMAAPHGLRVPGLMMISYVLLVHAGWYEQLGSHGQEVLRNAAQRCVTHAWRAMEQDDRDVLDAMSRAGATITVDQEPRAWRDKLAPLKARHFARYSAASQGFRELAGEQ
jgi:C4-dicarboxylate-binding protein DctP